MGIIMTNRWTALLVICMLAACASNNTNSVSEKDKNLDDAVSLHNANADPDNQIVCKRRQVIGTNMTKKVCTTRGQERQEREDARDAMDRIRTSNPGSSGTGEG